MEIIIIILQCILYFCYFCYKVYSALLACNGEEDPAQYW